ncbi:hypothetical protein AB0M97_26725 [Streptomyces sp. NPDC051207]|uniref:hypothetical protein n=1 Tax=Streptomyces sp. NPDC051207 TaxID=3154641 RepID=UPI00342FB059
MPAAIRDRGSSIRDNSDRTARVYGKRHRAGRWVCVTRSGGSIHYLRSYSLNHQTPLPENQPQRLRLNNRLWGGSRDRGRALRLRPAGFGPGTPRATPGHCSPSPACRPGAFV